MRLVCTLSNCAIRNHLWQHGKQAKEQAKKAQGLWELASMG